MNLENVLRSERSHTEKATDIGFHLHETSVKREFHRDKDLGNWGTQSLLIPPVRDGAQSPLGLHRQFCLEEIILITF